MNRRILYQLKRHIIYISLILNQRLIPSDVSKIIRNNIASIHQNYIVKDALFHGWTFILSGGGEILYPPSHFECVKNCWSCHQITLKYDEKEIHVPDWIIDENLRTTGIQ